MPKRFLTLLVLVVALCGGTVQVQAQPRPGAFTTVTTTDTSSNSLLVGCAVGSTSCTGGINGLISMTGSGGSGTVSIQGTGTISGAWTFTVAPTISGTQPFLRITETDAAANEQRWWLVSIGGTSTFQAVNDAEAVAGVAWSVTRSGATPLLMTIKTALAKDGIITPSALSSGSTNDYNPTGLSSAARIILTADAGGSTLTGLAAQTSGTEIDLCEPTPGAGSLTIASESGSSTAANRFNLGSGGNITLNKDTAGGVAGPCVTVWYYGAGSRWLLKSTSTSVP